MNERIKSLLAKAHLDVMEDLGDIDTNHVAEKFAELIVRECAVVAHNTAEGETTYGWMVGNKIKEHFGVEESIIDKQLRNRSTYFGNNP